MKKGIAIFGGTFDPFHNGHLHIVSQIAILPYVARVDIVPTWNPAYKECSSFEHRWTMCVQAITNQGLHNVIIRTLTQEHEIKYTIDLLKIYKRETKMPLYLFMGSDWVDISSWKAYEEIEKHCKIIVMKRDSIPININTNYESFEPLSLPISSSMIREKIRRKLPVNGLVDGSVINYIKEEGLYEHKKVSIGLSDTINNNHSNNSNDRKGAVSKKKRRTI